MRCVQAAVAVPMNRRVSAPEPKTTLAHAHSLISVCVMMEAAMAKQPKETTLVTFSSMEKMDLHRRIKKSASAEISNTPKLAVQRPILQNATKASTWMLSKSPAKMRGVSTI